MCLTVHLSDLSVSDCMRVNATLQFVFVFERERERKREREHVFERVCVCANTCEDTTKI